MRYVTLKSRGVFKSESTVVSTPLMQEGEDTTVGPSLKSFTATLRLSWYELPFSDPPRLSVKLEACHEAAVTSAEGQGPAPSSSSNKEMSWVLSVNLPAMPPPPRHHFYAKTWGENEGLLDQLAAQGWW